MPPEATKVKMAFADRLRRYREGLGLTQDEMAEMLSESRDRYAKYEQGVNEMPMYLLIRLSNVTEKNLDFWLKGREKKPKLAAVPK